MFGRYVSPQIRDYILQDPVHQRPGGTLREATILFLDMRGSTVYGEKKDPVLLLHDLNEFFGVIVPIVERTSGLLYRYTGDGFLAVFGAPTSPPPGVDHAHAALETAGALAHAVRESGERRAAQGLTAWRIGCSVHTGYVACGNLGTAERPDFTVIGDAVNLCAKMEEGNKGHCSDIVASAATVERLRPTPTAPPRFPPGVPEPFLVETARIGKRVEPTTLYYFCLPDSSETPLPEPAPATLPRDTATASRA
jgi:adenylate cyclase